MQLIFGDMRTHGRQLGHLMSLRSTDRLRPLELRGQSLSAALALLGQDVTNFVDSLGYNQGPMRSLMARLSPWLASALPTSASPARLTG